MSRAISFDLLYTLENNVPVRCHDPMEWAMAHQKGLDPEHGETWRIGLDTVGEYEISTVFLGMDMNLFGPEPLLFESMVFANGEVVDSIRASSYSEAGSMHRRMVKKIQAIIDGRREGK